MRRVRRIFFRVNRVFETALCVVAAVSMRVFGPLVWGFQVRYRGRACAGAVLAVHFPHAPRKRARCCDFSCSSRARSDFLRLAWRQVGSGDSDSHFRGRASGQGREVVDDHGAGWCRCGGYCGPIQANKARKIPVTRHRRVPPLPPAPARPTRVIPGSPHTTQRQGWHTRDPYRPPSAFPGAKTFVRTTCLAR